MNKHCKGCMHHHNAGHPKGSPMANKYNDWCTHFSNKATTIIGHCKLNDGKSLLRDVYRLRGS